MIVCESDGGGDNEREGEEIKESRFHRLRSNAGEGWRVLLGDE